MSKKNKKEKEHSEVSLFKTATINKPAGSIPAAAKKKTGEDHHKTGTETGSLLNRTEV